MNEPSIHTGLPAGTVLSLQPDEQPGAPCRFRLEGGLGQGGSAWVYRALRLGQNAQVGGTLKILALAGQPQMDRLRQVCTALHRLKRQEGLSVFIPYMDLYRDQDGHPCLFTPEDNLHAPNEGFYLEMVDKASAYYERFFNRILEKC